MRSEFLEQLEILRRICQRGQSMFAFKDSTAEDMFTHMRNEVEILILEAKRTSVSAD